VRRYRRMDLLKVLRLRHTRKDPDQGPELFGSRAPSGRISVRSNPAPYCVTAPICGVLPPALPRVGKYAPDLLATSGCGPEIRRAAHGYEPTREAAMEAR
jgi:hypothetical protein